MYLWDLGIVSKELLKILKYVTVDKFVSLSMGPSDLCFLNIIFRYLYICELLDNSNRKHIFPMYQRSLLIESIMHVCFWYAYKFDTLWYGTIDTLEPIKGLKSSTSPFTNTKLQFCQKIISNYSTQPETDNSRIISSTN